MLIRGVFESFVCVLFSLSDVLLYLFFCIGFFCSFVFVCVSFFFLCFLFCFFFFFSSRRRHTRLVSDWSSDVCSSDLRMLGRDRGASPIGYQRLPFVPLPAAIRWRAVACQELSGRAGRALLHPWKDRKSVV